MIAHKLVVGDTIYLEDGRPVRITNIGRGFGYNMLFIDFAQPASGEPVDFPWTCVSKNAEIGCERDAASLTSSPATRIAPPPRAGTRSDSRYAHEGSTRRRAGDRPQPERQGEVLSALEPPDPPELR